MKLTAVVRVGSHDGDGIDNGRGLSLPAFALYLPSKLGPDRWEFLRMEFNLHPKKANLFKLDDVKGQGDILQQLCNPATVDLNLGYLRYSLLERDLVIDLIVWSAIQYVADLPGHKNRFPRFPTSDRHALDPEIVPIELSTSARAGIRAYGRFPCALDLDTLQILLYRVSGCMLRSKQGAKQPYHDRC
jgi:hypothetical protein